jgi:hypothetical protein
MNNCDVFILISILIVVLLLIYNRNKREGYQIVEGEHCNVLGYGIPVAEEWGAPNTNANACIKNIAMLHALWSSYAGRGGRLEDMYRKSVKHLAKEVMEEDGGGSGGTERTEREIQDLAASKDANGIAWLLHANRGMGSSPVKLAVEKLAENAAKAEFKKLKTLEGATIQLSTSGIKCMRGTSEISCPDSIVSTGSSGSHQPAPAASAAPAPAAPSYKINERHYCNGGTTVPGQNFSTFAAAAAACDTLGNSCEGIQKYKRNILASSEYTLKTDFTPAPSSNYTCWQKLGLLNKSMASLVNRATAAPATPAPPTKTMTTHEKKYCSGPPINTPVSSTAHAHTVCNNMGSECDGINRYRPFIGKEKITLISKVYGTPSPKPGYTCWQKN